MSEFKGDWSRVDWVKPEPVPRFCSYCGAGVQPDAAGDLPLVLVHAVDVLVAVFCETCADTLFPDG